MEMNSKSDETVSFDEFKKRHPIQYQPDEELAQSWIFKVIFFVLYNIHRYVWGTRVVGLENVDHLKSSGWLAVGRHTTHSADIMHLMMTTFAATGRLPRGFMHRDVYWFYEFVGSRCGLLPGHRHHAAATLKAGYVCAVLPGGVEEGMWGHENAHKVHPKWRERKGWISIAREARAPIVPFFLQNGEEMKFIPIFYVGNKLRLGKFFDVILKHLSTRSPKLGAVLRQVCTWAWGVTSQIAAIPIPVQLTLHIGKPVMVDWDSTTDEFAAEQVISQLQELMDVHQPYGHQYLPGLRSRVDYLLSHQLHPKLAGLILFILGPFLKHKSKLS
eukprot:TRINITY_DN9056_c0_g2_i1.p1 TRINITY_DN9056_c0_g2~~TRINITY_DN9056_c0_g2_i1.p1  ORF type:complete len:329 (-),score=55.24 TRINITY_DN9056_c0_g2_i1:108-1094(-)